jgi:tRNA-specific 2-thiouridylase
MNSLGFEKDPKNTKVVVAMSGGVDSSVVACLLHEQGYDVVGITLQLYDISNSQKKRNSCCAGVDIYDAKKVADKLGFPHYILNYQDLFRESVIENFADSYLHGETPVPCIECNKSVKFRDLMKVAKDLNADALATGHYVQRKIGKNGSAELHKAINQQKDQSYFLFATTQTQLDFLRFPIGENSKEQTRKEAQRFGLEIADKPDSQDICFVPDGNYAEVIKKYRPEAFKQGNFIHIKTGEKLGTHNGIINFTLGQRRGLGISNQNPLYVIKINPKENIVFVGEEEFLNNHKFKIRNLNWLAKDFANQREIKATVKVRSNQSDQEALIEIINENEAIVKMKSMTKAITPGQACVIYQDSRVLGGGSITREIE